MFLKVFLASLFVAAAVAAPAPSMSDGTTPSIIRLESNVSCTSASLVPIFFSFGLMTSYLGANSAIIPPTPPPRLILLNNPSPPPSTSGAYDPYAGYAAAPQPSGTPPVVNLNAPAASPSIIKLNRRQFSSTSAASTFSFGGIVPSNTVPLSSLDTSPTSTASSFSFGSIPTSPTPTDLPNGASVFSSTGLDGTKTILILSPVTVTPTGYLFSSSPVSNPGLTPTSSPATSPIPPFSPLSPPAHSLFPASSASSFLGVNVQTPVSPSTTPLSSPSIINLNTPSAATTSDTGFSFNSAPAASVTPAPFRV